MKIGEAFVSIRADPKGLAGDLDDAGGKIKGTMDKAFDGSQVDGLRTKVKGLDGAFDGDGPDKMRGKVRALDKAFDGDGPDKMRGKVGALTTSVGGLGDTVARVGVLALFASSAKAASDLGEAQNATNVVFKEGSAQMDTFATGALDKLGLAESTVRTLATNVGGMFTAIGFSGTDAAKMTDELITRARDVGSVFNASADVVTNAFGSAIRGESEPARRFGVFLDEDALKAEALSSGLVKNVVDTLKLKDAQLGVAKAEQALRDTKSGGKGAATALEGQAAGRTRMTKATADATDAEKRYTDAVRQFGAGSSQAMSAEKARTAAAERLTTAKQSLSKAGANYNEVMKGTKSGSLDVRDAEMDLEKAHAAVKKAMGGGKITLTDQQKAQAAMGIIMRQTAQATGDYANTADSAANKTAKAKEAAKEASAAMGQSLQPVMAKVATVVTTVAGAFAKLPGPMQTGLIAMLAIGAAAPTVSSAFGAIGPVIGKVAPDITKLGPKIASAGAALGPVLMTALPWIALVAGIVIIGVLIYKFFKSDLPGKIWDAMKDAGKWLLDAGGKIISGLWEGLKKIGEVYKFFYVDLPLKILGAVADAGKWLLDAGINIVKGLAEGILGAHKWVLDAILGLGKKILGAMTGIFKFGSPSKVFAEMGGQLMAGLADGIAGSSSLPGAELAKMKLTAPMVAMPGGFARPGAASSAGNGAGGPVVVNLDLRGAVVGVDDLVDKVAAGLDARDRRLGVLG